MLYAPAGIVLLKANLPSAPVVPWSFSLLPCISFTVAPLTGLFASFLTVPPTVKLTCFHLA